MRCTIALVLSLCDFLYITGPCYPQIFWWRHREIARGNSCLAIGKKAPCYLIREPSLWSIGRIPEPAPYPMVLGLLDIKDSVFQRGYCTRARPIKFLVRCINRWGPFDIYKILTCFKTPSTPQITSTRSLSFL